MIRGATNDAASNGSIQPPVIHLHLCVSEGRVYSNTGPTDRGCVQRVSDEARRRIQENLQPKLVSVIFRGMKATLLQSKHNLWRQRVHQLQPEESQQFLLFSKNLENMQTVELYFALKGWQCINRKREEEVVLWGISTDWTRQSRAETCVRFSPQPSLDGGLRPALWGNWDLKRQD